MPAARDLTGCRYGMLIVVELTTQRVNRSRVWRCKCDCGNDTIITARILTRIENPPKSCGCRRNVIGCSKGARAEQTGAYRSWRAMRQRCTNPHVANYFRYGGRGITVCKRWNSFKNFLADMGERPQGMSIDRIDVMGNYEPSNCRWASDLEQANNKRLTVLVT